MLALGFRANFCCACSLLMIPHAHARWKMVDLWVGAGFFVRCFLHDATWEDAGITMFAFFAALLMSFCNSIGWLRLVIHEVSPSQISSKRTKH